MSTLIKPFNIYFSFRFEDRASIGASIHPGKEKLYEKVLSKRRKGKIHNKLEIRCYPDPTKSESATLVIYTLPFDIDDFRGIFNLIWVFRLNSDLIHRENWIRIRTEKFPKLHPQLHGTYIRLYLRICCARFKENGSLRKNIRFVTALELIK